MTPLHCACLSGNPNIVNAILTNEESQDILEDIISAKNSQQFNAIHFSCLNWTSGVLQFLIETEKFTNYINENSEDNIKPIHIACLTGCQTNVEILLAQKIMKNYQYMINMQTLKMGFTPLMLAIEQENTDLALFLIKQQNIDLGKKDILGRNALHLAAKNGLGEITTALLSTKILKINDLTNDGLTPLHFACIKEHENVVLQLINEENIDINASNKWMHEAPIHKAKTVPILNALLENPKIDLNLQNRNGMTALHIATKEMNSEIVEILLKKAPNQLDINVKDKGGRTALHYACMNSDVSIVKMLLKIKGILINEEDNDGVVPIKAACLNPNKEILDLFMTRNDITINAEDNKYVEQAKSIALINI